MFGVGTNLTPHLVGWLWADLLLGLCVIFLAAAAAPAPEFVRATPPPQRTLAPQASRTPQPTPTPRAVEPRPIEISVAIDPQALLSGNPDAVAREQRRIADEIEARLRPAAGTGQIAIALAFASHRDSAEGDRLTRLATAGLRSGAFDGAFIKSYPGSAAGDGGSTLTLEVYLFR